MINIQLLPSKECKRGFLEKAVSSWSVREKSVEELKTVYKGEKMENILTVPIDKLGLSGRVVNRLKSKGIYYMIDLLSQTGDKLLRIEGFGRKSLSEVRNRLSQMGLHLKDDRNWAPSLEQMKELKKLDLGTESKSALYQPIDYMNISSYIKDRLKWNGIYYIGELVLKKEDDLMEWQNFGARSLFEINEQLSQMGLRLKRE